MINDLVRIQLVNNRPGFWCAAVVANNNFEVRKILGKASLQRAEKSLSTVARRDHNAESKFIAKHSFVSNVGLGMGMIDTST